MTPCRARALTAGVLAGLCSLAVGAPLLADLFPDKNLETAVRKYVFAKRNNQEPLTEDDVKDLSTIEARGKKIQDLTGLEKCRSLAQLVLSGGEVADVGPLKGLKNLQLLDLSKNKIQDVSPLGELKKLQYLQLEGNQVSDLKPLAKLENLRNLYLTRNKVKDLAPLKDLTKLVSLYLDHNQVEDLKPLAKLKGLSSLDLRHNEVQDLSPLKEHTEYRYLLLDHNRIQDLAVLVAMAKKDAEKKRFAPFWNLHLSGNPLSDAAKSEQIAALKKLGGRITFKPAEKGKDKEKKPAKRGKF